MENKFKPFSTTLIGSMPRSPQLLAAKEACKETNDCESYNKMVHDESQAIMDLFYRVGIDVVVSGEVSRDNYMSYVAERVPGIELYSTEEIKALIEDDEKYAESLHNMDAADNSMNSPVCVDKIDTTALLNDKELTMLQTMAKGDYKITLPSPYLLTRSMWVDGITDKVYENRKELGKDVVELLKHEIHHLYEHGARVIQIDEPILSEVVFQRADGDTSFY